MNLFTALGSRPKKPGSLQELSPGPENEFEMEPEPELESDPMYDDSTDSVEGSDDTAMTDPIDTDDISSEESLLPDTEEDDNAPWKADAGYTGPSSRCYQCANFNGADTCSFYDGMVDPMGGCREGFSSIEEVKDSDTVAPAEMEEAAV